MKGYTSISKSITTIETVINKSRFIAHCKGVSNADEAAEFVSAIAKQYYDATHNCYAYCLPDYAKYSDDGEPQGTAGLPILDCIKKSGLTALAVVVTRYFGGIKLGAGGLVRAYSSSASSAIATAPKVEYQVMVSASFCLPYDGYQTTLNRLQNRYAVKVEYGEDVRITLTVPQNQSTEAKQYLLELTAGTIALTWGQPYLEAICL